MTIGEFALICLVVFLAVSISFGCFCAMISAIFKNSTTALSILYLLIFAPIFIPPIADRLLMQILNLIFPLTLTCGAIFSQYFYTLGNISLAPYTFYLIFNALLCVVFLPLAYNSFKNHQVN